MKKTFNKKYKTRIVTQLTKGCPQSCTIKQSKFNYLPWNISDGDYLPSSSAPILQLCKDSSVLLNLFRRSCDYKKYGQTDGQGDSIILTKLCLRGV